jgi:protein TonB
MSTSGLPRVFGDYLLTAALKEDALGHVFRAIRLSGEREFVRLRILESQELSEDSILDAIQEYGEIHSFLKNPAIARGVQMDAVDGTPFIAWAEESGRTLDAVIAKVKSMEQHVPPEHALLIAEKAATALDHALNTTLDGERTLHGLVWPGFISVSDDGETRLTGFGLSSGILPSLSKPKLAAEVAPYIAPEERVECKVNKSSDVYSVGAILFELLAGRLPDNEDPVSDVRALARHHGDLTPEVIAVLGASLSKRESRLPSAGELRRELGKLLFSGPYSPSTFNLAFFLNHLFGSEIEEETRARLQEAALDPGALSTKPGAAPAPPRPPEVRQRPVEPRPPANTPAAPPAPPPARVAAPKTVRNARRPVAFVVMALLASAVVGTVYVVSRAPERPESPPVTRAAARPAPAYTPTSIPTPDASAPTVEMTEAQFKDEVSRRVSQEMKKLEEELKKREEKEAAAAAASAATAVAEVEQAPTPEPEPAAAAPAPTEAPEPVRVAAQEPPPAAAAAPAEEILVPARIKTVVKPTYPPMALRQRIGGIVILRVLVAESGRPLDVQVLRGVRGGLSEAATIAVRRWTFEPATKNGKPVEAWTTVPIPFEP